ncbi:MAG: glycosyltransferase family 9 protein [Vallitaleaceae bacterium]|nr:glycosyltransferase family 9 protein [Vallitaleaceae bacterium]
MFVESKRGIWKEDLIQREIPSIPESIMRQFGISLDNVNHVANLEELRKTPPNIIIAEAMKTFGFMQNYFKRQLIKKRNKYVMGLGVFQQLFKDKEKKNVKLLKPASVKFKNIYRPYIGQDATDKTLLVFRTGGIGDLLFIQPNLIYLKQKYPTCKIKFACGPQYQPMVETWDCVDEVLELPFTFNHLIHSDYHMLFEGVIERCKEAEYSNAYNIFSKWLGLDLPDKQLLPRQEPKEHLFDECFKIIDKWGIANEPFVLMQLRASSPIRTPSHDFWVKIVDEINSRGYNIVLTDNPRQTQNIDEFIKLLKRPQKTFNFCKHSKSIDYTIALTKLSTCTIATDSALNHIAASLDVKCFGIFGPFPGHIRMKTYPYASWVDANKHCSPCYIHSHKPCKNATKDRYSTCYEELIDTDDKLKAVVDKFEELLDR